MIGKLSLVLTALLLILSLAGITTAALMVNDLRDQVSVTVDHITGDPGVLDGLSLRLRNTYNHMLFWDTAYTPATGQTETDFDFSAIRRGEYGPDNYRGVELRNGLHFGYSMSGSGYSADDFTGEERGLIAAYNKLYRETPNGEERTMQVNLADYYDYYPITGDIRLPDFNRYIDWEDAHLTYTPTKDSRLYTAHRLNEYFKIPILPGQQFEISIRKSRDGSSVSVGSSGSGKEDAPRYDLITYSVVSDAACYFTINAQTTHGTPMDVSQIEGGYGIYRLPCVGQMTDIDALQNVYPLDPADGAICALDLSADERELLLYRQNGDAYTLTVISLADMSLRQTLVLGQNPGGIDSFSFHDGGEHHLISLGFSRMLLVEWDEQGSYRVSLDLAVDENSLGLGKYSHLRYLYPTVISAWDGERLVLADNMAQSGGYDKYTQACDFYLAVFTTEGLQYYGICETSLNADSDHRSNSSACWPMDYMPLTLNWGSAS